MLKKRSETAKIHTDKKGRQSFQPKIKRRENKKKKKTKKQQHKIILMLAFMHTKSTSVS